jgi:hypothetical protein
MVHASLPPSWTAVQARVLAREVEGRLCGKRRREVLAEVHSGSPYG